MTRLAPTTAPGALRAALLALVLALGVVLPGAPAEAAEGRTLHISPDGQDPSRYRCTHPAGSAEQPYATFNIALRCLEPGGTLVVHEGTYTERVRVDLPESARGRADARVLVTGAPGEARPVIRGGLRIQEPDHWTIQDLEIVGDGGEYREKGFHPFKIVGGNGWVVQRLEVHDAATTGLVRIEPIPAGESGTPLSDWTIRDSCFHDVHDSGQGPFEDHNLYVWTGDGAGPGLIERNVMYGAVNGHNLKLGNRGGEHVGASDNVTVRFNTMVDAVQSMALVGDTDGAVIERNLMVEIRREKDFYPAVRGLYLSGDGNVVRDNAWQGADQAVLVWTDEYSDYGGQIADVDNREVAPAFTDRGCGGFHTDHPIASAYGVHGSGPVPAAADPDQVERVAGASRVDTSVEMSRVTRDRATVAVLARADDYPDALASSALAGLLDAPVLLSSRDGVPAGVLDELDRLGVQDVVLLGGRAALAPAVETQLRQAGHDVARIAGANRFETAALVADEVLALRAAGRDPLLPSDDLEVILVEGRNDDPARGWPDAVSAGQLAAAAGVPVLLTTSSTLPSASRAWLEDNQPDLVTVVGGAAAVSDGVVAQVRRLADEVRRLAGSSRYETAREVAMDVVERSRSRSTSASGASAPDPRARTFVASGRSFPDALAAGPAAASLGGVLVLGAGTANDNQDIYEFLAPVAGDDLEVLVVGGTAAISDQFEQGWPYQ